MSEIYKTLEKEVEQLESIENWSERVNKMKEIKENITVEQQKLNELVNMVLKDEVKEADKKKKKTDKTDLESLVNIFKQSENLDDKIKYYHLINAHVNEVEKQLFSS
jgi:NADH:ubiquinone oxidoreductase subunit D